MRRLGAVAIALLLAASACGDSTQDDGVSVVATTTMLGDVASHVVGANGTVSVLLPVGADPHEYQPSSRQAAELSGADLVVANGLGLEEGLEDVLESAAADGANVLALGEAVDPLPLAGDTDDPHVWFDPLRMGIAARLIADELTAIDPSVDWAAGAAGYVSELEAADVRIGMMLAAVPEDRRKLVTNHDALGYFADRYGFEVIGVVVPGGSTLAEPSSADLADLVATIRQEGVPAIFAETTEPTVLAEAVAREVGAEIDVVELFIGSLGESGSGADTLIGMLLINAARIAEALS